jgi:hypothetical protein
VAGKAAQEMVRMRKLKKALAKLDDFRAAFGRKLFVGDEAIETVRGWRRLAI